MCQFTQGLTKPQCHYNSVACLAHRLKKCLQDFASFETSRSGFSLSFLNFKINRQDTQYVSEGIFEFKYKNEALLMQKLDEQRNKIRELTNKNRLDRRSSQQLEEPILRRMSMTPGEVRTLFNKCLGKKHLQNLGGSVRVNLKLARGLNQGSSPHQKTFIMFGKF